MTSLSAWKFFLIDKLNLIQHNYVLLWWRSSSMGVSLPAVTYVTCTWGFPCLYLEGLQPSLLGADCSGDKQHSGSYLCRAYVLWFLFAFPFKTYTHFQKHSIGLYMFMWATWILIWNEVGDLERDKDVFYTPQDAMGFSLLCSICRGNLSSIIDQSLFMPALLL